MPLIECYLSVLGNFILYFLLSQVNFFATILLNGSVNTVLIHRSLTKLFARQNNRARVMVFNNISIISWLSVLLVEEIGVPVENH